MDDNCNHSYNSFNRIFLFLDKMEKITSRNFITDNTANKVFISSLIDRESGGLDKKVREKVKSCIEEFAGKDNCELLINTKDVWARDYMPIQLTKEAYLGYTYKPDYLDSGSGYEKCVTNWRLHNVHAEKFNFKKIKCVQMPLVLDGGNVVKAVLNDKPCMIMCEKVLKENNVDSKNGTEVDGFRNWWKEWWKENFDGTEMELVLLPWEGRELNPIGHADGMVRYIGNNSVLMTNYKDFDKSYEDYSGEKDDFWKKMRSALVNAGFKDKDIKELEFWDKFKDDKIFNLLFDRSWCYINFLQLENRILVPRLGYDKLDNEALKQIKDAFKLSKESYEIELIGVDMTSIVENMNDENNSGGALNCLTWTIDNRKAESGLHNCQTIQRT